VVDVNEKGSPSQQLRIPGQARRSGYIGKRSVLIVAIERCSIVREVGFDDVEPAVAVVVDGVSAHSGLLVTFVVVRNAGFDGDFFECPVMVVVKQQVRSGIAGDKNVRPAVVVEVSGESGETVVGGRLRHA